MKHRNMKLLAIVCMASATLGMGAQTTTATLSAAQTVETLSLQQCLDEARSHNRSLTNAALDVKGSELQKKEAYTKYFPQISATALAFKAFDDMLKGEGTIPQEVAALGTDFAQFAGMPYSYSMLDRGYYAGISLVQPVFAGGKIVTSNKMASTQTEMLRLYQSMNEKEVLQKVTETYWQIVMVKNNLSTIEAAEKQVEEIKRQVSQYVDAGVTTRNDLLRVNLRKQELASSKLKLRNAREVLSLLLAQQIGRAGQQVDVVDDIAAVTAKPADVLTDAQLATQSREEYQLSQLGVTMAQHQVTMERAKLLPSVGVGVSGSLVGIGGLSSSVKDMIDTDRFNAMVFATVSVPISDWWGGSKAIKRQKIKLEQVQNDLLDAQEQLAIDIESSWKSLVEAYEQIGVAQVSVDEAEENLRMSTDQYNAGTCNLSDLLDAETLNRQSLDNLANAKAQYEIQLADYLRKTK